MRRLAPVLLALALAVPVGAALAARAASPFGGVYQTTIKGKGQLNGKWLLSFDTSGIYEVAKEPSTALLIGGISTLAGHTIRFYDQAGPLACVPAQAHATYSWTLSGKKLRLHPVKESCSGRKAVLSSAVFVRIR
jgi:hypothetical protein